MNENTVSAQLPDSEETIQIPADSEIGDVVVHEGEEFEVISTDPFELDYLLVEK
ncbi:hypothetical protein KC614_02880 [candidate division WWE3 bacterium]|uniref:Uncharacterized protein n=1 Tax=candidate division WWE3 bacterium TaxID=2053526 RepID=A0A955LKG7_UNCKA|nr:hypothetical protein [candidate division WWE3 bacterium]